MIYPVCILNDGATLILPENACEPNDRECSRIDHVPQEVARTHGRKLVDVADKDYGCRRPDGPQQGSCQHDIKH